MISLCLFFVSRCNLALFRVSFPHSRYPRITRIRGCERTVVESRLRGYIRDARSVLSQDRKISRVSGCFLLSQQATASSSMDVSICPRESAIQCSRLEQKRIRGLLTRRGHTPTAQKKRLPLPRHFLLSLLAFRLVFLALLRGSSVSRISFSFARERGNFSLLTLAVTIYSPVPILLTFPRYDIVTLITILNLRERERE